jgi:hypothetical protein
MAGEPFAGISGVWSQNQSLLLPLDIIVALCCHGWQAIRWDFWGNAPKWHNARTFFDMSEGTTNFKYKRRWEGARDNN